MATFIRITLQPETAPRQPKLCAADHGIPDSAQGMASRRTGPFTSLEIHGELRKQPPRANREGVPQRQWRAGLVRACPLRRLSCSRTAFDHVFKGSSSVPTGNWITSTVVRELIMAR